MSNPVNILQSKLNRQKSEIARLTRTLKEKDVILSKEQRDRIEETDELKKQIKGLEIKVKNLFRDKEELIEQSVDLENRIVELGDAIRDFIEESGMAGIAEYQNNDLFQVAEKYGLIA